MKAQVLAKAKKEYKRLEQAILNSDTTIRKDYVIELYRHWAKISAIENALLKKGILTKEEILKEEISIWNHMEKDFVKRKSKK